MEQSLEALETYVKSMKIKKTVFGGYDPEDVIRKMTELVRLTTAMDTSEELEEYRRRAEAADKAKRKCLEQELALAALEEKLRHFEEENERLRAALKQECRQCEGSANAGIPYQSDAAAWGTDPVREQSRQLGRENWQMRHTLEENVQSMHVALDNLLSQGHRMREALLHLQSKDSQDTGDADG